MSLQSWMDEFYPEDAGDFYNAGATSVELVEHSLRKWRGLRGEALERHHVELGHLGHVVGYLDDGIGYVEIDGSSCALCHRYAHPRNLSDCVGCPLQEVSMNCNLDGSHWWIWKDEHDPEPMISCLEDALEYAKEKESE